MRLDPEERLKSPVQRSMELPMLWQVFAGVVLGGGLLMMLWIGYERYQAYQVQKAINATVDQWNAEISAMNQRMEQEAARMRAVQIQAAQQREDNQAIYQQLMQTCTYWRNQYNNGGRDPLDREWMNRACREASDFRAKNRL